MDFATNKQRFRNSFSITETVPYETLQNLAVNIKDDKVHVQNCK